MGRLARRMPPLPSSVLVIDRVWTVNAATSVR
jgi:hypothetical protein